MNGAPDHGALRQMAAVAAQPAARRCEVRCAGLFRDMRVIERLAELAALKRPVLLAAGFFDGVHRGHQRVIRRAIARARDVGGEVWILTFGTHPMKVLRPENAPPLLTCNRHKAILLERCGVDGCARLPFNRRFARRAPDRFVRDLLRAVPRLAGVFVGRDWRFGRGGTGDARRLRELAGCAPRVNVTIVAPAAWRGAPISSTRIRDRVRRGDLRAAAAMLGRPFGILGTVRRGHAVGRRLGFPTANLSTYNEVLPPHGVYAVHVLIDDRPFNGILNVGFRPTFRTRGTPRMSVEVHVLDFDDDLYGRDIEVFFIRRIRGERTFASAQALRDQIARDAQRTRQILPPAKKFKETLYTPHRALYIARPTTRKSEAKGRTSRGRSR